MYNADMTKLKTAEGQVPDPAALTHLPQLRAR